MKSVIRHYPVVVCLILFVFISYNNISAQTLPQTDHTIYDGRLSRGYDMGVASSGGQSSWVTNQAGYMRMAYPSEQSWGAVFITFGKPRNFPRPGTDLSMYEKLSIDLRGLKGGERVEIGLKDSQDPDNGTEAKIPITVTKEWNTYEIPLSKFYTADLSKIYVITEFVFGYESATVDFKNVKLVGK